MDIVIWMTYGFFSFYVAGDFIGLRNTNLKAFALRNLFTIKEKNNIMQKPVILEKF
jgi:hypothetical protein